VSVSPANLAASAVSPTQISLTWEEPPSQGFTQVGLERSTNQNGPFNAIAQVAGTGSYLDTNLAGGTTYYYRARAENVGLWSDYSSTAGATTMVAGADLPLVSLSLWLKADTGLPQGTTNASINQWLDQSGNQNNALQTTALNRPEWVPNVINGLPAVHFDGTNDYFGLPNLWAGATEAEAFVVMRAETATPSQRQGLWSFGSSGNMGCYPEIDGSLSDDFCSGTWHDLGVPAQPLTQFNVYEVSSGSTWSAWINGVLLYQASANGVSFASSPFLGACYWGRFTGDIAEVMIFHRTLTDGERATVNGYLAAKYALGPSVPLSPANLVAAVVSSTQISLTWAEPPGLGFTQIELERSTNNNGSFTRIAQVAGTTSYLDTNLAAGTPYYYRARAENVGIWSPYSATVAATTLPGGADLPLGSLALWLKADTGLPQGSTNTSVNQWLDQSGNQNNALQTTALNRPEWVPNVVNGLPAVHFDGTNEYFGLPNLWSGAMQAEAFVVVRAATATPSQRQGLWSFGSSGNMACYPEIDGSLSDDFCSGTWHNMGVPAPPLTQFNVYEVSSGSTWEAWLDGFLLYQANANGVSLVNSPILGACYWGRFTGDIAEVMVFNRSLTDSERGTVNGYLEGRYGLIPTVSVTVPNNNAIVSTGNIQISANAFETGGGAIKQVEFFAGTNSLGVSTSSPYAITWANVTMGAYAITAQATGVNGLVATSSVVNIFVDPPPAVSITAPLYSYDIGIQPLSFNISAIASEATTASGVVGIKQVEFLLSATSVAVVTNKPYGTGCSNIPAGIYQITAVATGNNGLTNSARVSVLVDTDTLGDGLGDFQKLLYDINPGVSNRFLMWTAAPKVNSNIP